MKKTKIKSLLFKRKFLLYFQVGIFCLLFLFPRISAAEEITPQKLINLTNQERLNHGLDKLRVNEKLTRAAQAKANDMVAKNYFNHFSPDGLSPWHWIKQSGYAYTYAGENLAMDFIKAESVVKAWMQSSTHRKNILNPKYREIGVAVLKGTINDNETTLVVQMFGGMEITTENKNEPAPSETKPTLESPSPPPPKPAPKAPPEPEPKSQTESAPQPEVNSEPQVEIAKEPKVVQDIKNSKDGESVKNVEDTKSKKITTALPTFKRSNVSLRSYFIIPNFIDFENSAFIFVVFSEPVKIAKIQYGKLETYLTSYKDNFYLGNIFLAADFLNQSSWHLRAKDTANKELSLKIKRINTEAKEVASSQRVLGIEASNNHYLIYLVYLVVFLSLAFIGVFWTLLWSWRKSVLSSKSEVTIHLIIAILLLSLFKELSTD